MKKSIVLLSGGLDSAANLAIAAEEEAPQLALTFNYGQRASASEIRAAQKLCKHYGVSHQVIELPWLGALGGSSLTDQNKSIPEIASTHLDDRPTTERTAQAVWVPNRNGIFINVAAAIAERNQIDRILVGFNSEEAATFPDNSIEFLESANRALMFSTANQVKVASYTAEWNKRQIVSELRRLEKSFPFDLVWSCYEGREEACQTCESCQRLARALNS